MGPCAVLLTLVLVSVLCKGCRMHFVGCVWFCGAGSAQKSQNLIEGFCVFRRLLGRLNFLLGGVRLYWLVVVHQGMRTF